MSRGIGRCQRRIMDELTKSPSRTITRLDLDAVLVEGEGYDASNVLRSIRALTREHLVTFIDHRHKAGQHRDPATRDCARERGPHLGLTHGDQ